MFKLRIYIGVYYTKVLCSLLLHLFDVGLDLLIYLNLSKQQNVKLFWYALMLFGFICGDFKTVGLCTHVLVCFHEVVFLHETSIAPLTKDQTNGTTFHIFFPTYEPTVLNVDQHTNC